MPVAAALQKGASPAKLADAAEAGLEAIQHYGGARPGSRTMLDALAPATAALKHSLTQGTPNLSANLDGKDAALSWRNF